MGIAAEVIEYLGGTPEWRFCVYDPFGFTGSPQETIECVRITKGLKIGKELQLPLIKSLFEEEKEFLTEQSGKNTNGEKESLPAANPSAAVSG